MNTAQHLVGFKADLRCYAQNVMNVVTVSGGKDSLAQWLLAIEAGVEFEAAFADTGHEHAQTMDTSTIWNHIWDH